MLDRTYSSIRRNTPSQSAFRRPGCVAAALAIVLGAWPLAAPQARQAAQPHHRAAPKPAKRRGRPAVASAADILGARIVAYALQHQGQSVGTGQCAALADAALRQAGARSADSYGDIDANTDYIWGRRVALRDARPGDILQFRNYNITTELQTTRQYPDGRRESTQTWAVSSRPHHTAIVERNLGGSLLILEQNAPPSGSEVQEHSLPVAPSAYSTVQQGSVPSLVTTTIQVNGEIAVYRPQAAPHSLTTS